jgi:hypothetical protein
LSIPNRRQSASSEAGEPGKPAARDFQRVDRLIGRDRRRPAHSSSAFRNRMSKDALWITSLESSTKSMKACAIAVNTGLSARNSFADAVHVERFFGHVAFGVDVLVIGAPGRHLMPKLDRADLDDPVPIERVQPVVSVSSTISRMFPCPDLVQQVLHIGTGGRKGHRSG